MVESYINFANLCFHTKIFLINVSQINHHQIHIFISKMPNSDSTINRVLLEHMFLLNNLASILRKPLGAHEFDSFISKMNIPNLPFLQ